MSERKVGDFIVKSSKTANAQEKRAYAVAAAGEIVHALATGGNNISYDTIETWADRIEAALVVKE